MSLVGSLEDLNLGDILQIISLSQKSGVLSLETTGRDGRIVFANGLVRSAAVKGGPQDLRGVLVHGGFVSEQEFSAAEEHAIAKGCELGEAVSLISGLPGERIESLCREVIESAVIEMFSWSKGDFSFDVRTEPVPGDPELLAPAGLNAQYLAMEGARVRDERGPGRSGASSATDDASDVVGAGFDAMSAHEMFGATPAAGDVDSAPRARAEAIDTLARAGIAKSDTAPVRFSSQAEALAAEIVALGEAVADAADASPMLLDPATSLEEIDLDTPLEGELGIDGAPIDDGLDLLGFPDAGPEAGEAIEPEDLFEAAPADAADGGVLDEADLASPAPDANEDTARLLTLREVTEIETPAPVVASPSDKSSSGPLRPLVAIDLDLLALEWVKSALKKDFRPVHIFQQTDQAMARIRQYLVRGTPPVVLIAPDIEVDRLGGVSDVVDFVARLKAQSPRIVALWLREDGAGTIARMGAADGVLVRPARARLRASKAAEQLAGFAADFARQVKRDAEGAPREEASAAHRETAISPDSLRRLKDATRSLTEASSRGEVLPLVIRFASEVFDRVAMFMVRDGTAIGMAQHGLPTCAGPDDHELRDLAYPCGASSWMGLVLQHGKPVRGAPANDGDRDLAGLLGDRIPDQAYLAPIESGGQVIALLYGDNLPDGRPLGDTSALEVVLHHAGLALDRAALERALREDEV